QDEQQVHRMVVDGVEVDRLLQFYQGTGGGRQVLDAAVGHGDAVADAGAAQLFAGDQRLEQFARVYQVDAAGNQFGALFEQSLLADTLDVTEGHVRTQQFGEVHGMDSRLCCLLVQSSCFLSLDGAIDMDSRYLAMVRRATRMPLSASNSAILL